MPRLVISLAILGCLAIAVQVHAAERQGKEFANAFIGGCLQVLPNLDKVEAAARAFDWKPVEGEIAEMLAPKATDAKWKAWFVMQPPAPAFFIFISSGVFLGEDMAICGVSNPYAPISEVFPHLKKALGLERLIGNETSAGQRTRVWKIEVNSEPAFVSLVDAELMGEPGLTLSGMMKAKK